MFKSFKVLSDDDIFTLLDFLDSISLIPKKYGSATRGPNRIYFQDKKTILIEFGRSTGWVCIMGKNFKLELSLAEKYNKPYLQKFTLTQTDSTTYENVYFLSLKLFSLLSACYGFVYRSSMEFISTTGRSIENCLGGFTFINLFGKPYLDLWGKETILNAPASIREEEGDIFVVSLSENLNIDVSDILELSRVLITHFGNDYFSLLSG